MIIHAVWEMMMNADAKLQKSTQLTIERDELRTANTNKRSLIKVVDDGK